MASVLLVDDDVDGSDVLARYLRKAGHQVTLVPNGRKALAALGNGDHDVVLLDVMMPEMDGMSFLEVVRTYLRWQSLPVILLTAYPDLPDQAKLSRLNVHHVMHKSVFRLPDLLAAINGVVLAAEAAKASQHGTG